MNNLRNTLMALAAPAEVQDWLYPDFTAKGDELVLEYSQALGESDIVGTLTSSQLDALKNLEQFLTTHSGKDYVEMYCETNSLYTDPRWEKIREYARRLIAKMGWQYEHPARNGALYVSSSEAGKNT